MPAVKNFDDIRALLSSMPAPDTAALDACRARDRQLTKPGGSLGRLEEITEWLCTWQGSHPPRMERPRVCIFAGNHGVAALGVSAFPAEVTVQMVRNYENGGAATDLYGNKRVGLGLSGKINRSDFGITWNKALETGGVIVGEEVKIDVALEGILQK